MNDESECGFYGCSNDRFKNLEYCALHCDKNSDDNEDEDLRYEFNILLENYI